MSNKSDKQKQAALQQRSEHLSSTNDAAIAAAEHPSQIDTDESQQVTNYFDFQKDPNRDYSKVPGMAYDSLAEEGAAEAESERTALGAMQFGAAAADPNLQAVLKSNSAAKRAQNRGLMLNDALAKYDAMMRGQAADVAARDQSRRLGVAGMTTGASENALNSWAQFTPRPSPWLTLGTAALGAAGTAAGGIWSDERLKEDIRPIGERTTKKLKKLHGVKWKWKEGAKHVDPSLQGESAGVVAQDVEKEFPELVDQKHGFKRVNYGPLAAMAIEALKDKDHAKAA